MIEFDSINHEYKINGISVPSVTRVLGAGYYCHNEQAMKRGSKIHTLTYMYDKGDLELDFLVGTEYFGYVSAWVDFKKITGIKLLEREKIVGSELYMCAGTLDILGIMNRNSSFSWMPDQDNSIKDLWLLDIKSGSVSKRQHQLQVSGYKLFHERKKEIDKLGCVYLKPNGSFNLVEYKYDPSSFIQKINDYKE
ncbi:hypothetical protein LCGC14_0794250 [marine sediment metagenome]|uniref:PD-(D/E)XK endonuclease-like domain-containing protein n=1 Tax=marine sediment metagenome TaxID=412755 RepID=A0A0F9SYT0_9ZZZZ